MKALSFVRTGLFISMCALVLSPPLLKAQTETTGFSHAFYSQPQPDQATWWQVQAARRDDNTDHTSADLSKWATRSATLEMEDFQFNIPKEAHIDGIEVVVIRRSQGNGSVGDHEIYLVRNGRKVGENLATTSAWDKEWTAAFYGGPDQLLGGNWSPVLLNSSHFGINLSVRHIEGNSQAQIDEVNITIHYSLSNDAFPASALKKRVCIPGPF